MIQSKTQKKFKLTAQYMTERINIKMWHNAFPWYFHDKKEQISLKKDLRQSKKKSLREKHRCSLI